MLSLFLVLKQVDILVGDSPKAVTDNPNTRVFKLNVKSQSSFSPQALSKMASPLEEMKMLFALLSENCDSLLNNEDLMEEIKTSADLIIGDSLDLCSSLIADKFSLPHVTIVMSTFGIPTLMAFNVHNPPSYVPQVFSELAGDLGFLPRVKNTFSWIKNYLIFHFVICPAYDKVKVKHNITPNKSIRETLGRVDLLIGQVDFPIEVPRPLLPSKYLDV